MALVELLVASAIMATTVAALAVLAHAVQVGTEYSEGHGEAVQHGRVTLERITRLANEATASSQFPGLLALYVDQDGHRYPDTLVIWHPTGTPLDPEGLPRFNEVVIFCAHADRPGELIELTAPGDTRTVPPYGDRTAWLAEIDALKASESSRQVALTHLVQTASTDGSNAPEKQRPCVRFNVRLRPSDDELAECTAGEVEWDDLPWVQNVYSPKLGLRQAWLRIELQLVPGSGAQARGSSGQTAIPLFDSAAVYYTLEE